MDISLTENHGFIPNRLVRRLKRPDGIILGLENRVIPLPSESKVSKSLHPHGKNETVNQTIRPSIIHAERTKEGDISSTASSTKPIGQQSRPITSPSVAHRLFVND